MRTPRARSSLNDILCPIYHCVFEHGSFSIMKTRNNLKAFWWLYKRDKAPWPFTRFMQNSLLPIAGPNLIVKQYGKCFAATLASTLLNCPLLFHFGRTCSQIYTELCLGRFRREGHGGGWNGNGAEEKGSREASLRCSSQQDSGGSEVNVADFKRRKLRTRRICKLVLRY
jgi:hypothetical protein